MKKAFASLVALVLGVGTFVASDASALDPGYGFAIGEESYGTLSDAYEAAKDGDTITIEGGTYQIYDTLLLEKSLAIQAEKGGEVIFQMDAGDTSYRPVIEFGAGSGGSIIDGITFEYKGTGEGASILYFGYGVNGGNAETPTIIRNNNFKGVATEFDQTIAISSTYNEGIDYVEITNNLFSHFKYAAYLNSVNHLAVKGNVISNTKYNAINIAADNSLYECANLDISNNDFSGISVAQYAYPQYSAGVRVGEYSKNITISYNKFEMVGNMAPVFVETADENVNIFKNEIFRDYIDVSADLSNYNITFNDLGEPGDESAALIKEIVKKLVVLLDLDINITNVSDGVSIHETDDALTFVVPVKLDEEVAGYSREYHLIRIHNGVAEKIDFSLDADNNKLSFASDKYSEYVFGYVDTPIPADLAALKLAIQKGKAIDAELYETAGIDALLAAIQNGQVLVDDAPLITKQSDVDAATKAIEDAIAALVALPTTPKTGSVAATANSAKRLVRLMLVSPAYLGFTVLAISSIILGGWYHFAKKYAEIKK